MGWGEGLLAEQCSPSAQVSLACSAFVSPLSPVGRGHATPGLTVAQAPVASLAMAATAGAHGCSDSRHVGGSSGPSAGLGGPAGAAAEQQFHINASDEY